MHAAMMVHIAALVILPLNVFEIANRTANVTIDRAVRYWSAMYNAVPATGIVNNAATVPTAAQRASASSKHSTLNCQHACNVKNIEATYQMKTVRSNERCDMRMLAAMSSSNRVKCA